MKYLLAFAMVALLIANAAATGELITSMSRDFPTTYSYNLGAWKYNYRFNNGTITNMTYDSAPTNIWWTEAKGDGIATNESTTFNAENGKSTVFYLPTAIAGHTGLGNVSANWTANFTGTMTVSGWFQHGSLNKK
jgi:hypothetical protein